MLAKANRNEGFTSNSRQLMNCVNDKRSRRRKVHAKPRALASPSICYGHKMPRELITDASLSEARAQIEGHGEQPFWTGKSNVELWSANEVNRLWLKFYPYLWWVLSAWIGWIVLGYTLIVNEAMPSIKIYIVFALVISIGLLVLYLLADLYIREQFHLVNSTGYCLTNKALYLIDLKANIVSCQRVDLKEIRKISTDPMIDGHSNILFRTASGVTLLPYVDAEHVLANLPGFTQIRVDTATILLICGMCGAFGVLPGLATFVMVSEESPPRLILALLVAATITTIFESLRDLISHGPERHRSYIALRSVGTLVIVAMFEIFVLAYEKLADLRSEQFTGIVTELLGGWSSLPNIYTTLWLWICTWTLAGFVFSSGVYTVRYPNMGIELILHSPIFQIPALGPVVKATVLVLGAPITNSINSIQQNGLISISAIGSIFILSAYHFYLKKDEMFYAMIRVLFIIVIVGAIFGGLIVTCAITIAHALVLTMFVWLVPGMTLGMIAPLLDKASLDPRQWSYFSFCTAGVLVILGVLEVNAWYIVPVLLATVTGVIFIRTGDFILYWPFTALTVATTLCGLIWVVQSVTFMTIFYDVHRLMMFPIIDYSQAGYTRTTSPLEQQITSVSFNLSPHKPAETSKPLPQYCGAALPTTDETVRKARILELCLAGATGFWTVMGLLAAWRIRQGPPVTAFVPKGRVSEFNLIKSD